MRVFQSTYKDRKGQTQKTDRWYIELIDHLGTRRRIPGLTDRKASEATGRSIEKLVRFKVSGEPLDPVLTKWVETLNPKLRARLAKVGLLDAARVAALRPLAEHVDGMPDAPGWRQFLTAKGNTPGHVDLFTSRVRRAFEGCQAAFWSDISATRLMAWLNEQRKDTVETQGNVTKRGLSAQSVNHFITALNGFGRWMVREGRASENPMVGLRKLNPKTDKRHPRRALTVDELRWLLTTTRNGPERCGMTGYERVLLYRVAVETGLRSNELRSLTRSSFKLDGERPHVAVQAGYSKRKRDDALPLRADTAVELRDFLACKLPDARVFNMPKDPTDVVTRLYRPDLAAAREAWLDDATLPQERQKRAATGFLCYVDSAGRFADFHALRHTTGSLLAASGVHPKVAQSIMRHSSIELTMNTYSHVLVGQEADAVASLPSLDTAPTTQRAKATGTSNVLVNINAAPVRIIGATAEQGEKNLAMRLAREGEKERTLANNGEANHAMAGNEKTPGSIEESQCLQGVLATTRDRTRTCNLRFRRPMLYPIELLVLATDQ